MRDHKFKQLIYTLDSVDMAANFLDKVGVLQVNPKMVKLTAQDLDESSPASFI